MGTLHNAHHSTRCYPFPARKIYSRGDYRHSGEHCTLQHGRFVRLAIERLHLPLICAYSCDEMGPMQRFWQAVTSACCVSVWPLGFYKAAGGRSRGLAAMVAVRRYRDDYKSVEGRRCSHGSQVVVHQDEHRVARISLVYSKDLLSAW